MKTLKDKVVLSTQNSFHLVEIRDIIYCQSENVYTTFFLKSGDIIRVSVPIKTVEQQLKDKNFARPHQSFLVNLDHIKSINKLAEGELILSNNIHIPYSSRKKGQLIQLLDKFTRIQSHPQHIQICKNTSL